MYSVCSVFSGIGGIETGFERVGFTTKAQVEIDDAAWIVLEAKTDVEVRLRDVRLVKQLPKCDVVAAGFPCQDLSQCGLTSGINGEKSSLVFEVFRLIRTMKPRPEFIVLENVPFMLQLEQGLAMKLIVREVESLGYRWAYRTIDARAFGLPQRRKRVVFLAALDTDPKAVLFSENYKEPKRKTTPCAYGFYWTEGKSGLGWAADCVPTLKGGSGIGIPSPPAVWNPLERSIGTIDIRDAERLQGFQSGYTNVADKGFKEGVRWRLVGNAVPIPFFKWLGNEMLCVRGSVCDQLPFEKRWPSAACGQKGKRFKVEASHFPVRHRYTPIMKFLKHPLKPLSERAIRGFYGRTRTSALDFNECFLRDLETLIESNALA